MLTVFVPSITDSVYSNTLIKHSNNLLILIPQVSFLVVNSGYAHLYLIWKFFYQIMMCAGMIGMMVTEECFLPVVL